MPIFRFDEQKSNEPRGGASHSEPAYRRYFPEFVGTFILVFGDAGMGIAASLTGGDVSLAMRAIAPGLAVMAMIFAIGERSGAHINPAVTLAFTLRGVFPWRQLPIYWLAQIAGALAAAFLLRAIFGNVEDLGSTHPEFDQFSAFVTEITLTFILIFVILSTAHQSKLKGPEAAIPVGGAVALCGLIGKGISGASMNPARSLGPALASGNLAGLWIYLLGPALGSLFALVAVYFVHGRPKFTEEEAAKGEKNI